MSRRIMIIEIKENKFDEVFEIMKKSFPRDEYRDYDEQKALIKKDNYHVYGLLNEENKIKAFIALYLLNDLAFIEHFAVAERYRNQGLGQLILNEIRSLIDIPLCLEVELPYNDLAKRRIAFYKRNGFFLNEYPYMQPAFSSSRNPITLYLMTSNQSLNEEQFMKVKQNIMKNIYHHDKN